MNAKSVANYFLQLAEDEGEEIDPMKLQKLIYYAHGWYAGNFNEPLLDDAIQAWRFGPVIPSIYHEFKRFGAGTITAKATAFDGHQFRDVPIPEDEYDRKFLDIVWRKYKGYTGKKLSEMTHADGSPWDQVWEGNGNQTAEIPFPLIQQHFAGVLNRLRNKTPEAVF